MVTPVAMEPLLGYHPCSIGFLTSRRDPAVGQCQTGSLTGAVASERVSEAPKGSLRMDGNHSKSAKAEGSLTATPTGGAGTKVGLSDPVVLSGNAIAQRIKATLGTTKICFDVSMAVIAAVLSFVFAGRLDGVREGTVISAYSPAPS